MLQTGKLHARRMYSGILHIVGYQPQLDVNVRISVLVFPLRSPALTVIAKADTPSNADIFYARFYTYRARFVVIVVLVVFHVGDTCMYRNSRWPARLSLCEARMA
jgi:hypothetical protein